MSDIERDNGPPIPFITISFKTSATATTDDHPNMKWRFMMKLTSVLFTFTVVLTYTPSTTSKTRWTTAYSCTSRGSASASILIDCVHHGSLIQIGRAHYGVSLLADNTNKAKHKTCEKPSPIDCTMDYTNKIAEQCNGLLSCRVNLISQYVHKCQAEASYLYLTYKCVKGDQVHDVCKYGAVSKKLIHLTSPNFPMSTNEETSCECRINAPPRAVLSVERVNLQIQEPHELEIFKQTEPPFRMDMLYSDQIVHFMDYNKAENGSRIIIRFSPRTSSRFWMTLIAYPQCPLDWVLLDNKCARVIKLKTTYTVAQETCRRLGGHLLTVSKDPLRAARVNRLINDQMDIEVSDSWFWVEDMDPKADRRISYSMFDGLDETNVKNGCMARNKLKWTRFDCKTKKLNSICEQEFSRLAQPVSVHCDRLEQEKEMVTEYYDEHIMDADKTMIFESETQESPVVQTTSVSLIHHHKSNRNKVLTTNPWMSLILLMCIFLFLVGFILFCNSIIFYVCCRQKRKHISSLLLQQDNTSNESSLLRSRPQSLRTKQAVSRDEDNLCYRCHCCCPNEMLHPSLFYNLDNHSSGLMSEVTEESCLLMRCQQHCCNCDNENGSSLLRNHCGGPIVASQMEQQHHYEKLMYLSPSDE